MHDKLGTYVFVEFDNEPPSVASYSFAFEVVPLVQPSENNLAKFIAKYRDAKCSHNMTAGRNKFCVIKLYKIIDHYMSIKLSLQGNNYCLIITVMNITVAKMEYFFGNHEHEVNHYVKENKIYLQLLKDIFHRYW